MSYVFSVVNSQIVKTESKDELILSLGKVNAEIAQLQEVKAAYEVAIVAASDSLLSKEIERSALIAFASANGIELGE